MSTSSQIIIAGGGFAGFACAKALAERGIAVTLLERKSAAGVGMHTTGIIVKECAEEFTIPDDIVRKVTNVRLFSPSLKHVDLKSSDYFFLTTDTPRLMQFLAREAASAGANIIFDTAYEKSQIEGGKVVVNGGKFDCDFLIGADGPRSKVAADYNLGKNTEFLLGAEAEYTGLNLHDDNAFYCFLDQELAHGYLGWVIPGVGVVQVGLAQRMPRRPDIDAFVSRMKNIFDFSQAQVAARRGGLIPCGGLVRPFANERVILLGDAAGIVSPLTAGGIHTALRYGRILGETLAGYMQHGGDHPAALLEKIYPRFYLKLLLRKIYEHTPNGLIDFGLTNPLFSIFAQQVFYKKKRLK
ncbi:MAG: NAD(P)/FAD-dependent oxidoreductase [Alphaproteobacteria bacterium]|nr:NAD(P)/FAD-dependent oxidoreductase [Alphaproteobacteria bacterium]